MAHTLACLCSQGRRRGQTGPPISRHGKDVALTSPLIKITIVGGSNTLAFEARTNGRVVVHTKVHGSRLIRDEGL